MHESHSYLTSKHVCTYAQSQSTGTFKRDIASAFAAAYAPFRYGALQLHIAISAVSVHSTSSECAASKRAKNAPILIKWQHPYIVEAR